MARFSPDHRAGQGRGRHRRDRVGSHGPAAPGERFTGLCPFHDERTPSFSVDPAEKLYHCFGCGVGGDVFTFVEEKEGLGVPRGGGALADRYGVEVEREREDPRAEEARKRRARLVELLERTAAFYSELPVGVGRGAKAREYLAGRGLARGGAARFRRGLRAERSGTRSLRGQQAGF